MLFNSFEFVVFLPVVFMLYWFVFRNTKWQNVFVLAASYFFYGWWDWRFLLLIAFTTLCSFFAGIIIERNAGHRLASFANVANIVVNLAILAVFKYYDFFAENLSDLFATFGYRFDFVTLNIILPVGISFYTFQALGYSIDVYRGQIKATRDFVAFASFISFFPQLVAGPIERATNLLPQFQKERHFRYETAVDGMRQMLAGFFKKMVIADNCAIVVNTIFADCQHQAWTTLMVGGVLFCFQIYGDFSGYSDIAIGCAKLFGFHLNKNFNNPYLSRNVSEFWRRWHISLMKWFRDYVYIPMGGSRKGKWRTVVNTLVVFSISGLWHGANWTFVLWGTYHGILLSIFVLMGNGRKYKDIVAQGRCLPRLGELLKIVFVFALVSIGFTIFRCENIAQVADYFACMFSFSSGRGFAPYWVCLAYCGLFIVLEWIQRERDHLLCIDGLFIFRYRLARWALYYLIVILLLHNSGSNQTFIYFQF